MMTKRSTGGTQFIPADARAADLTDTITKQLRHLEGFARETGKRLDLGELTIETRRIGDGRISVSVTADLESLASM